METKKDKKNPNVILEEIVKSLQKLKSEDSDIKKNTLAETIDSSPKSSMLRSKISRSGQKLEKLQSTNPNTYEKGPEGHARDVKFHQGEIKRWKRILDTRKEDRKAFRETPKGNVPEGNKATGTTWQPAKKSLKAIIEKSIILNPDIDRETIVKTICDDYMKKSQDRKDSIDKLEDELKKTTSTLYCQIPEDQKELYKSIFNVVEPKLQKFPSMYADAFTILEYMKRGGKFMDPADAVPVEYNKEKGNIEHHNGDGDVSKQK